MGATMARVDVRCNVLPARSVHGGASGHFLSDLRNPSASNLVNVAISRAKHALVVVADVHHLRRHLGADSSLFRVIRELLGARDEVDAPDDADVARLRALLRGPAL